jgi:O-antigen ligase
MLQPIGSYPGESAPVVFSGGVVLCPLGLWIDAPLDDSGPQHFIRRLFVPLAGELWDRSSLATSSVPGSRSQCAADRPGDLDAGFIFHPDLKEFSVRSQFLSGAPGSIDYALSAEAGVSIALLLGTLLFITDCASDPLWRRRIIFTLVAAGTTLILFGLVQRLCSAPSIFWAAADTGKTFFATYRYHSNAGAFINMVWPLVTAGLLISVRRGQRFPQRLAWGIALTLCLVGLAVTGARAAGGIAIVSVLVALAWTVRQTRQGHLPALNLPVAISAAILCFLVVATAAATAGLDVSARRWNKVGELFSMQNPRLVVDEVCLKMIPDAGWFGFGPGTFCRAFPYYTNYLGDSISGVWMQAHQDYLQTIIEWGVVGALAWAICIGGAVIKAYRFRSTSFGENTIKLGIMAAVLMTLLHATVDFPLQIPSLQLYFATFLGLLWSAGEGTASTRRRSSSSALPSVL